MILGEVPALVIIYAASVLGIVFGLINACIVSRISMFHNDSNLSSRQSLSNDTLIDKIPQMEEIAELIARGSRAFLRAEYKCIFIFIFLFAVIIALAAQSHIGAFWTTSAFLLGAFTSVLSGYIGMKIAVKANVKTTKEAFFDLGGAFICAYRGGAVMGFTLVGLGLAVLVTLIKIYQGMWFKPGEVLEAQKMKEMFEYVAGYGLGGSTIALFCRVGGGIYTKAADMGADLVGKVVQNLPEDSPLNPACIADNVGDNVGDIAGMGSDLFGSFAEATCACLVISGSSQQLVGQNGIYFPLLITASGIFTSFITSFLATNCSQIRQPYQVQKTLKIQLLFSTVLQTPAIFVLAMIALPESFTLIGLIDSSDNTITVTKYDAFICAAVGLWGGLAIGFLTEYYTSHSHAPVQQLSYAGQGGPAPLVIEGLALGYSSTIFSVTILALIVFCSFYLAEMYGISLAALGMLSTMSIGLTIDAYGPIADNAGGIAEMVDLQNARERTDALDAAGNTTAAIGKGFAIGSALLVALALFGAFVIRTELSDVNILQPLQFAGVIFGAMLPYAFSAWTLRSTSRAANKMINEIRSQFQRLRILEGIDKPEYQRCIEISTHASLREMVAPGLLVILTPLVVGFVLGREGLSGVLAGAMASGVQMAISFSNAGGAWDNAKKYIEGGFCHIGGERVSRGCDIHRAAVIGDTVGDPLKDTSGPSLNILIKLMAIISLVFGGFFLKYSLLKPDALDN